METKHKINICPSISDDAHSSDVGRIDKTAFSLYRSMPGTLLLNYKCFKWSPEVFCTWLLFRSKQSVPETVSTVWWICQKWHITPFSAVYYCCFPTGTLCLCLLHPTAASGSLSQAVTQIKEKGLVVVKAHLWKHPTCASNASIFFFVSNMKGFPVGLEMIYYFWITFLQSFQGLLRWCIDEMF